MDAILRHTDGTDMLKPHISLSGVVMNERIKHLAKKVDAVFEVRSMGRHDGVLFTETELERFVELIVKECVEVAANVVVEHEGVEFGLVEACYQHFGVK